jgi:ABC-type nitrate/sulfonate/bicarbonate transport system permease component
MSATLSKPNSPKSMLRRFISEGNHLSVISVAVVLLAWIVITSLDLIRFMPSPQAVILSFFDLSSDLFGHIKDSLIRVFAGFALGSIVGIVNGIAISWNKAVGKIFDPLVEFFRPMPPLALIPLFIVWFGIGDTSKILLIAFGCWVNMVVITAEATRNVNPLYINAARTLGANEWQTLRHVVLPALVPGVVGGIRTAAVVAYGMDVAAEFMGTNSGFGYIIIEGRRFIRLDLLFLGILLITAFSMLTNLLIRIVENRLTRWVPRRNE